MVLADDGDAVVVVGQPSHAWVSGQLARAWGNERFGAVDPRDEVCLAAEQHDLGMVDTDLEPELHPETGWPRSFMQMDLETHLGLWSAAPNRMRVQSRYAALLVGLHGAGLYERRNVERLEPSRASAIRAFLERQHATCAALLEELAGDPQTAALCDPESVARNRGLVRAWDSLSLALLLDWAPYTVDDVAVADGGAVSLCLRAISGSDGPLSLDPWPFSRPEVRVHCEGRRLMSRFDDEEKMRAALARAPWETLRFRLVPAES